MKVAIVGLEQVGKTTLFGALTRQPVKVGPASQAVARHAVVEVPDPRFDVLVEMFRPRRRTRATVEFVDGGARPGARGNRFGAPFLEEIRQAEALVAVLRAFRHPAVPEPAEGLDPLRDFRELQSELILADLDLVEKRLERLEKQDRARPRGAAGGPEKEALLKIRQHLEQELPIASLALTREEVAAVRHLDFVTSKPLVVVGNIGEADLPEGSPLMAPVHRWAERSGTPVLEICAAVELEVAQLGAEEEAAFLEALGIRQSGRDRLIRTVYDMLGLISFFTVGEEEVRAWTLRRGETALNAAGKIHSDMARGFIRAEVIPYEDLARAGSPRAAREQGRYRLESKPYVVQDGDILTIRFSV